MSAFKWIEREDGRKVYRREIAPCGERSDLPAPMIISDTMNEAQHPVDGKHYSSKSTFSRITRDAGYVEVGNDPARFTPLQRPKSDRKGIKEALQKAHARLSA